MRDSFKTICLKHPWIKKSAIDIDSEQIRVHLINQDITIHFDKTPFSNYYNRNPKRWTVSIISLKRYSSKEELDATLLEHDIKLVEFISFTKDIKAVY